MVASERRLDLKLGFACNNRCLFCAQGEKRTECSARPAADLLEELRRARPDATGIVLTGGEPTLYKKLVPLVAVARRLGFRSVQLQTNGRLLAYPEILDALLDAGVTEIAPSLHGPYAKIHDALTRAPGSFDETTRGIRNALARSLPVVTNSVITCQNVDLLPGIIETLASLGVRQAQLAFVHPVGTAFERFDDVVPDLPAVVLPVRWAREAARRHRMKLWTEAIPLCFLRGMQDLAVESIIPLTTVSDLNGRVDYSEWRVREGKAHGPPCRSCAVRMRCEGPWREYPERRGWREMQPFAEAPA